jgi:hypothetical protein
MALNFNVDPYYDDFDPSKNFHRILFKPGAAVQARELTQSQTILQDQISKFADSIFAQNTPVNGGKVTTNFKCSYLKLNRQYNGANITAANFANKIIQDSTGTILAKVIATSEATGTDNASGDPPTLIITYFSGGSTGQFTDAVNVYLADGGNLTATTIGSAGGTTCTGYSSVASISEGVFYIRNGYSTSGTQNQDGTYSKYAIGNFVSVQPQTIVLNKYSSTPSYRLGLSITETVVDYIDDSSLLDPAVGASNYQAPGADRYQVLLTLITLPLELGNDDQFIELVRINNGVIVKQVDGTVYSTIDDYFAKRTYDTNGDFIVNDFSLSPVSNTSNTSTYDLKISKGLAYVHGYRVDVPADTVLTNDRSRTTQSVNNNSVYVDYGSYFYVDTANGLFDVTTAFPVDFHTIPGANIATANATTYTSTLVGSGYIRNLSYVQNTTDANTKSYVYKAHVYDITTNSLNGTVTSGNATHALLVSAGGKLSPYANAYYGVVVTIPTGPGAGYRGQITSYNPTDKSISVNPPFTIPPTGSSTYTLKFETYDIESIANTASGTTTLNVWANINAPLGKVGGVTTGDTNYVNATNPELLYPIGFPYVSSISDSSYYSTKVWRNKAFSGTGTISLTLTLPPGIQNSVDFAGGTGTISADAVKQNYTVICTSGSAGVGSIVDFSSSGNTVSISTDKNSVTFSSTYYTTPLTVSVISKVNITDAGDSTSILRTKTLVTGNTTSVSYSGPDGTVATNTKLDLTKGQVYILAAGVLSTGQSQSLYVADVKNIVRIIDTKASGTVPTTAMLTDESYNITSNYSFSNGQKDGYYDHAFLKLNSGAPKPKGNILVIFNYYSHSSSDGYFSVASYTNESYAQIPSYTAKSGITYSLRDSLDFRPSRLNATSSFVFEYSASPTTNDTGFYIPQDLTNWISDYNFYYGRKDRLVLTRDKNLQIVKGNPSANPIFPTQPDGSLLIANLTHDPYTAYLPSESPKGTLPNLSVEKVRHRRWTMNDISDMNTRINNIEYYTTLNALEVNAQNLQVRDNNGLNRFKNGILVDDFTSYGVGDTSNPDFSASIDRIAKKMSAAQTVQNYPLHASGSYAALGNFATSANTLGYQLHNIGKGTNIFTLPYTTTPVITQQLASQTVNINPFASPVFQGTCQLNPPMDNWVDNTKEPDLLIVDPNLQVYQQSATLNTLNVTNWQTIPGTASSVVTNKVNVEGHNINPSPFGYLGYTATTTTTSQTQQQTTTQGYWSNLGSSYNSVNGYITDISIQPYIREQFLLFSAKGLKVNTPVQTFFDGVSVDQYITNPDIVELTSVSGSFKENDVIGYTNTSEGVFLPIATVLSVYKYPNTTNVRLYVASNFHTTLDSFTSGTVTNAFFDAAGNKISSTASGTSAYSTILSFNNSGYVTSSGGSFTDAASQTISLYRQSNPRYCSFLNQHGVWNVPGPGNSNATFNASFTVNFAKAGNYTFTASCDNTATILLDGVSILSAPGYRTSYTTTIAVTAGNHVVRWLATNTGGPASVGLTVANSTGLVIFDSAAPTQVVPTGTGVVYGMTGGGAYYTGVTQIGLNPAASSVDGYYIGTTINITTTYVSQAVVGGSPIRSTQTYTRIITGYTGATRMATWDVAQPINVSMGSNTLIGGNLTSTYSLSGMKSSYKMVLSQGGHPTLSTNENGDFVGVFSVPSNSFRTGERIFRVDNRTTPNDPNSATTWCEATFTASGLSTKSQSIDFSPSISAAKNVFTQTKAQTITNTSVTYNPWDPVAQGFIIDAVNYPNGTFISSVKFFFQSKPTTTNIPIELSIVGTSNGYPNGQTLDHSIVSLTPDRVNANTAPHYLDSGTYTEFTFPAPVFIQPGILYAFLLKSASQDYNIYVAAQNATALPTTVKNLPTDPTPTTITKIGNSPYVAALFESQNAITWTADQTKALMFVVNRCVFKTDASPTLSFVTPQYLPTRKGISQDIQKYYDYTLVSNLGGTYSINDQVVDAINVSVTDFVPTKTNINYSYLATLKSTGLLDSVTPIIPGKFGTPTFDHVYLNDGKGERLLSASSANSFYLYATMTSPDPILSPVIADDGTSLYNVQWNINNMGLSNSSIALISGGTGYSNSNTGLTTLTISAPDLSGGTQAYASANVDNGIIQSVFLTNTGSGYLNTPTITIVDANTTPGTGGSIVATSEYSSSGGNSLARYVTKKNTLADSSESADLRLFFTAYRPSGSNIYVFYRIQNKNDSQTFENGAWQLMTYVNNTGNAFSTNRNDTMEFEAAPGLGGVANNQLSYTSTTGTVYTTFNQFAIKIVLSTNDNTSVPYLTDIRALALPAGTGI